MRASRSLLAMFALAAAGCGINYDIRTMVTPDARLSALGAFRVDPGFEPLRDAVTDAFRNRGYTMDQRAPDFLVSVQVAVRDRFAPPADNLPPGRWPDPVVMQQMMVRSTDGVVTIEVLTPKHDLLWRGTGSAPLVDDRAEDLKTLARVADAIVVQFPAAQRRALAVSTPDPALRRR